MFDYDSLKKTATQLITKFGTTATITRDSGRRFNPATGHYFTGLTESFSVKAVRTQFNAFEKAGDNIKDDDIRLLVQSGVTAPIINDSLTFDSVTYRVMSVATESPSGPDIFYDIQCRS